MTLPEAVEDSILEWGDAEPGEDAGAMWDAMESAILAWGEGVREGALREAELTRRALLDLFEAAGNESDGEFNGDRLDALRDAVLAAAPFVVPRPEPEPAPLTKEDVLAALARGNRDADDVQKALDATFGPEGEP